jgi:WD40 repeat protein
MCAPPRHMCGDAVVHFQTLRGHDHVVETVCYGRRPRDAAAIMASAGSGKPVAPNGVDVDTAVVSTSYFLPLRRILNCIGRGCTLSQSEFSYLASGGRDRAVRLWDPLRGHCLMTFTAHENWVRSVVFHPSFKFLISCSDDKTIRVMDIKVGHPRFRKLLK